MCRGFALAWLVAAALLACAAPAGRPVDSMLHPPTVGPTPTLPAPSEHDLAGALDQEGTARSDLIIESSDGWMRVEIPAGTRVLTAQGDRPGRIAITPVYGGRLPRDAFGYALGIAYEFGPEEIRFDPTARLIFRYDEKAIGNTLPHELGIGRAYGTEKWVQYDVEIDRERAELRASVEALIPGWRYLVIGPAPLGS